MAKHRAVERSRAAPARSGARTQSKRLPVATPSRSAKKARESEGAGSAKATTREPAKAARAAAPTRKPGAPAEVSVAGNEKKRRAAPRAPVAKQKKTRAASGAPVPEKKTVAQARVLAGGKKGVSGGSTTKKRALPGRAGASTEGAAPTRPALLTQAFGALGAPPGPRWGVMPAVPAGARWGVAPVAPEGPAHLDWDDADAAGDPLVARWVARGDDLLAKLEVHGAARHEYRADLKQGRFVWLAPDGRVSAEAQAQALCSWSRSTSVVAMAWADPLVRGSSVARIEALPAEQDDVDEESAWRIAMEAAETSGADYLYRVPSPHAWYFLALRQLTFTPAEVTFSPGTPVGLVLRGLSDTRTAIASRAEPTDVLRERLSGVGRDLLHQSEYAYRDTDWVARLERTGKRLLLLSERLTRPTFRSVAAGLPSDDWLDREAATELCDALGLLEDEWSAFA